VLEWEANERHLINAPADADLTITELIDRFWRHAQTYYRHPDGSNTGELTALTYSLRALRYLHGATLAKEFGPSALKGVRELFVTGYEHPKYGPQKPLCRNQVNARTKRIRRVFRWAVENELVPPSTLHGLQAVAPLKRGRTTAKESAPVKPVARGGS